MKTKAHLQALAQQFAKEYWNLDFNIPIKMNPRLTRARARFCRSGLIQWIDFQPNVLENDSEENIIKTLKHEVCHWALFNLGKPYRDGQPHFENELRRIGSHSTGTVGRVGESHYCQCSKCKAKIGGYATEKMARRRCGGRYISRCCQVYMTYLGSEFISRTTEIAAEIAAPPAPVNVPSQQEEAPKTLIYTAKQAAELLKMDDKTFRRKLRAAGYQKEGSGWTFTRMQIVEIKTKLGL